MNQPWVIVGNEGCRRVAAWNAALARHRIHPRFFDYSSWFEGALFQFEEGARIRFESAAENPWTYRNLLSLGFPLAGGASYKAIEPKEINDLPQERGILPAPWQAFLGLKKMLLSIEKNMGSNYCFLNLPTEILFQYDKTATIRLLQYHGLPVPQFSPLFHHYDQIRQDYRAKGRAMVKLRHGSGGAGCMAIHWARQGTRAFATVREESIRGKKFLFAAKRPQYLKDEREIAHLVNRLAQEKIHTEEWLPKAQFEGHNVDFRIVTINGRATHAVARGSHHPFTNLNLGNRRIPIEPIISRLGSKWMELLTTAERVAACFPKSHTLGIDLLLHADFNKHFILEVNPFGNLIPGIKDQNGLSTYEGAVNALLNKEKHP